MKLELNHLAPYLPYGLKLYSLSEYRSSKVIVNWGIRNCSDYPLMTYEDGTSYGRMLSEVKPILRPMSDLSKTKLFDNYGDEKLTAIEEFEGNWDLSPLDWVLLEVSKGKQIERLLELNYLVIEELIKHHFDVFGLIDSGLSIDINTL